MKRFLTLLMITVVCLAAAMPAGAKSYTISVTQIVEHPALDAIRLDFMEAMKQKGFDVEYNVHIAQGNMATANLIAKQMLGEKPDLVLAIATPTAQAAAQAIRDIPILITAVTDPVGAGLVESLEKPGAHITGMTDMSPVGNQVDLIREIVPAVKKLGIIYNSGEANSISILNELKQVCAARNMTVEEAPVTNSAGVTQAARSLVGRADAVYIPTDNTVVSVFEAVTKVSAESDLPLFAADVDSVGRGAIAAYAVDYHLMGRQTADMAEKVLKGADTATMPVETLKEFLLHLNPASAAEMGVTIPASVMDRADKVVK
jgi:putative ABC transport system substrate-binding protein